MTIQLSHLNKTFSQAGRQVKALQDISITIEDQDIFGIIGFSGAGKSTMVRCINGLEIPDSGKVLIDGVQINALKPAELRRQHRKTGMIFQQFNLMPSRTVIQNVLLTALLPEAGIFL